MGRTLQIAAFLFCSFTGGAFAQIFSGSIFVYAIQQIVPGNVQSGSGSMWQGVTAGTPQNWSYSDRVFVGNAAFNVPLDRNNTNTTYVPNSTAGANWAVRDSQLVSMNTAGVIGVTGFSRASDGNGIASTSSIGVSGFGIGDLAGKTSRGGYFDLQYTAGSFGYGLEINTKNASATNNIGDPYNTPSGSTYGIQIDSGDDSFGPTGLNPTSAAIWLNNGLTANNKFNSGIVFGQTSLATNNAIALAAAHQIRWYTSAGVVGSQLMSGAGSPAGAVSCTARCLYIRTDGGANTTLYINETGGGTAGWAAK